MRKNVSEISSINIARALYESGVLRQNPSFRIRTQRQPRMKILLLHHSLNSAGGGEKVCLTTVEALREAGHEIILATADKIDWKAVERYYGKRFEVDERQLVPSWFRLPGSYRRLATFCSTDLRSEVDLTINMHGDVMLTRCGITYVHIPTFALRSITGHYGESFLWRFYLAPYEVIQRMLVRRYFEKTFILTNSTYLQKIIKEFIGKNSTVVHPPVDVDSFFVPIKKNRDNIVVSCGRLSFEKRLDLIPDIARLCPEARFYIMGSTGLRSQSILNKIGKKTEKHNLTNIEIKKNPTTKEMKEIYSRAKIYLHTAIGEYFGISVAEGMASGLAPIIHKSGGTWTDIVKRGKYGLGYDTIKEAANSINRLLMDEEELENVQRAAQQRSETFSEDLFKRKIGNVIEQLS